VPTPWCREQLEALGHSVEERLRLHHAHPRRCELDRQGQTVEELHQRLDGRSVVGLEVARG
jgi:hypothetical protein